MYMYTTLFVCRDCRYKVLIPPALAGQGEHQMTQRYDVEKKMTRKSPYPMLSNHLD